MSDSDLNDSDRTDGGTRGAGVLALAAALLVGLGVGYVVGVKRMEGRLVAASSTAGYVNPLADVTEGESLVLRELDGARVEYRVARVGDDGIDLEISTTGAGQVTRVRRLTVGRNFFGYFHILASDDGEDGAGAWDRQLRVARVVPDRIELDGRTWDCWRVEGVHQQLGDLRFWVTNELPVHGLLKLDGPRGERTRVDSWGGD